MFRSNNPNIIYIDQQGGVLRQAQMDSLTHDALTVSKTRLRATRAIRAIYSGHQGFMK